jgi:ADP-ribose pyrophosphatase YjhB (NUDIX family)
MKTGARREALEGTRLVVDLLAQLNTYSDPGCDSRQYEISTVFVRQATGEAQAKSDAQKVDLYTKNTLLAPLVFHHTFILNDYFN